MVTAWPRLHFLMAKKGQVRLAVANFGQGFPAMKKEPQYGAPFSMANQTHLICIFALLPLRFPFGSPLRGRFGIGIDGIYENLVIIGGEI